MVSYEEHVRREDLCVSVSTDPVVLELNRLQNLLAEKNREVGAAQSEIKALRATEALKDKALEELRSEVYKLDDKLRVAENLLESKNLEIKRLTIEKKDALAAQYAAEGTLRRVHANQKDDDSLTIASVIASVIAPLESEIKMYKNEVALLHEDKKALERLTKSKELALLEAERILQSALERALIVEEVQNHNFELKKQIEICQEENRLLEKTNRQKVIEVERLGQTIEDLEEAILAGGATANTVRDYKRQIDELHEEKRTLERELARAKVSANRVATVLANEWKDESDRVMPVKQWLEERRLLQAEMQRLREKLAVSERTAKAEAQLKEKFKLRLKTLEEGLKHMSIPSANSNNAFCGSPKTERSNNILGFLTSNGRKRSTSQTRSSVITKSSSIHLQPNVDNEKAAAVELNRSNSLKKKYTSACENMVRKSMWVSRSKVVDSGEKENKEIRGNKEDSDDTTTDSKGANDSNNDAEELRNNELNNFENEDTVSGFLYDKVQKEVINLRKLCELKDGNLIAKDEEVQMLMKKVDALTKAMEVEFKKMKREAAVKEKEAAAAAITTTTGRVEEKRNARTPYSKRPST